MRRGELGALKSGNETVVGYCANEGGLEEKLEGDISLVYASTFFCFWPLLLEFCLTCFGTPLVEYTHPDKF